MFTPQNEQGVVALFAMMAKDAGWEIVSIGAAFPDAVWCKGGEEWSVEFELLASNFLDHKHDHRKCDIIVCWENDYADCPLPIIALNDPRWMDSLHQRCSTAAKEAEYWKRRALSAERKVRSLSQEKKIVEQAAALQQPSTVVEAYNMRQNNVPIADIARKIGKSERTVNNYIAQAKAQMNGHHKEPSQ